MENRSDECQLLHAASASSSWFSLEGMFRFMELVVIQLHVETTTLILFLNSVDDVSLGLARCLIV